MSIPVKGQIAYMKSKIRFILLIILYITFAWLSLVTLIMYSAYSDWMGGNSHNDGLGLLLYFFFILPAMLVLSTIKFFLWGENNFGRYSHFLYTGAVLVFTLTLTTKISQLPVTLEVSICLIVIIANLVELIYVMRRYKSSM